VLEVLLWASNYGANLNLVSQDPYGSNRALQNLIKRKANEAWKKYERKELSEYVERKLYGTSVHIIAT